jgi:hypothetical protein
MKPKNYVAKAKQSGAGRHTDKRRKIMHSAEMREAFEEAHMQASIDDIVMLMIEHGSSKIMNLVYDKYIEVSYALLEKQHEQEEF